LGLGKYLCMKILPKESSRSDHLNETIHGIIYQKNRPAEANPPESRKDGITVKR